MKMQFLYKRSIKGGSVEYVSIVFKADMPKRSTLRILIDVNLEKVNSAWEVKVEGV